MVTDVYFCDCSDPSHQLHISHYHWGEDCDPEFGIVIHLNRFKILKRIKYAFKYIFGWQSKHGAFHEMMLNKEDVERLRDSCNEFIEKAEKPEFQHGFDAARDWLFTAAKDLPADLDEATKAEFAAFLKCFEALPQFTEFDPAKPCHTNPRIWSK